MRTVVFLIKLDSNPRPWDMKRRLHMEVKLKIWIRLDKVFGPIMSPSIFVCTMCVVEGPAGPTQLLLALLQLSPYLPTTSGSNIYTNYQNRSIDFYTVFFRLRRTIGSLIFLFCCCLVVLNYDFVLCEIYSKELL